MKKNKQKVEEKLLKLDFGCGMNCREGFEGVDIIKFNDNIKYVVDLTKLWPWKDNSVEEAHASHFIEHLSMQERCHFVNELYRILIPGGKATIITPHWCSCRAYGDPTHIPPAVSEFWFYYLSREWRLGKDGQGANAPHTDIKYLSWGFNCDFEATWGYNMHPTLLVKNQEMQNFALQNYKESAQDMLATLTCRK